MPTGRVVEFDAEVGWGSIVTSGADEARFHATAIVDGSRTIDAGTVVHYDLTPGRSGRWEATNVEASQIESD